MNRFCEEEIKSIYIGLYEANKLLREQINKNLDAMELLRKECNHTWSETGKDATFVHGANNICYICHKQVGLSPQGIINTIGL